MTGVVLRPMSAAEYDAWIDVTLVGYADQIVASGILPPDEALVRARADFDELLTDGRDTAEHCLWTALDAETGVVVGSCWVKVPAVAPPKAFVYSFDIDEDQRRRGYGRAMMEAVIEHCRGVGAASIGLNVFGHNIGAQALYANLGFDVTSTAMKLAL